MLCRSGGSCSIIDKFVAKKKRYNFAKRISVKATKIFVTTLTDGWLCRCFKVKFFISFYLVNWIVCLRLGPKKNLNYKLLYFIGKSSPSKPNTWIVIAPYFHYILKPLHLPCQSTQQNQMNGWKSRKEKKEAIKKESIVGIPKSIIIIWQKRNWKGIYWFFSLKYSPCIGINSWVSCRT